jgi:hypothetical protein
MTTEVTVKVPTGATYEVEMDYSDIDGTVITTYFIKPGETLSIYIYGSRVVSSIREVPLKA